MMSARKARKLADGSRKEGSVDDESDFSLDNEFSINSRKHQTRSTVGRSLENSLFSDHQVNGDTQHSDEDRTPLKRKRILNGGLTNGGLTNGKHDSDDEDVSTNSESSSESDAESDDYSQSQPATQNGFSQATIDGYESSQLDESQYMETQDDADNTSADALPPDCGTIESIQLFNFMCHDHFEITFNPRVNFVIGKNGSK